MEGAHIKKTWETRRYAMSPASFLLPLNLEFLFLQVTFQVAHAIYIIISVSQHDNMSHWDKYEAFVASFINSGAVSVVLFARDRPVTSFLFPEQDTNTSADVTSSLGKRVRAWLKKSCGTSTVNQERCFGALLLLNVPLAPGIFTHVVPMIFMYCWIFLPLMSASIGIGMLTRKLSQDTSIAKVSRFFVVTLCLNFFALLIQSSINYGVLVYSNQHSYIGVIVEEFNLRSTVCYYENVLESVRSVLAFLSYVL